MNKILLIVLLAAAPLSAAEQVPTTPDFLGQVFCDATLAAGESDEMVARAVLYATDYGINCRRADGKKYANEAYP